MWELKDQTIPYANITEGKQISQAPLPDKETALFQQVVEV